jgi:hypothetical protein
MRHSRLAANKPATAENLKDLTKEQHAVKPADDIEHSPYKL